MAYLVKKFYSEYGVKEWKRLAKDPYHRLEFDTTMHFLKRYLPKKGLILDAGGGPGRYTVELAKLGYDIILFDLTPELLEIAKGRIRKGKVWNRVKQIVQGSISDLSVFESGTFDAVVCTGGPLSHVTDKKQRERAIDELIRVAKKGAPIFVSVIGRLSVLASELINHPEEICIKDVFQRIRDTGDYHGGYGFAPSHFYLPEELMESFGRRKVKILGMAGLEGVSTWHRKETNALSRNSRAWKVWWETHLKTCTHQSIVGTSEHLMIISRKL